MFEYPGVRRRPSRALRTAVAGLLLAAAASLGLAAWGHLDPQGSALQMGEWALRAGDAGLADAAFRRYLAAAGRDADALYAVGGRLLAARRWDRAAAHLERAVAREPGHRARVLLAVAYEKMGRDEEAGRAYREAARIRRSDPVALNGLGYYYAQRGIRLEEAVGLLHRALELSPDDGAILDSLGWALYQRGDLRGAVAQLHVAVVRLPSSGEVRYHLGVALARAGMRDRAVVELGKALMLEPDIPGLRDTLEQVRSGVRPPTPLPQTM